MVAMPGGSEPDGGAGRATRTAVLVLGMHRSGTSLLTRLIGGLGVALPADAGPPGPDNPEGYWEPAGIVALNDRLLAAADSAWLDPRPLDPSALPAATTCQFRRDLRQALQDSFAGAPCFVLKDPRICRLVPLYRQVLGDLGIAPKVVVALREPPDVAASLGRRNQLSPDYAGILWARHMLDAERDSRDLPRATVAYSELLDDWRGPARRIERLLGRGARAGAHEAVPGPVRADLRHHQGEGYGIFDPPVGRLVDELHAAAAGLDDVGPDMAAATFDRLAAALAEVAAARQDLLTVELCCHRLSSPHPPVQSADPDGTRRRLGAALGRLHRGRAS